MIKSKFSLRYFCFFPLFLIVFETLIIYGLLQSNRSMHAKDVLLFILLIGGPFLLILFLLLGKMTVLRIWPDRLQLRGIFFKKTIHKDEITSINLSAREITGLIGNRKPANAIVIEWGKTERFVLVEFYYRNVPVLKQALQEDYLTVPGSDEL